MDSTMKNYELIKLLQTLPENADIKVLSINSIDDRSVDHWINEVTWKDATSTDILVYDQDDRCIVEIGDR